METGLDLSPLDVLAIAGLTSDALPEVIERDANGCAIWPLGKFATGYGCCYPRPGEPTYVHRLVCAVIHGPIPPGWHVDHVWERGCRSKACFWPGHLEAVTPAENARRMGIAMRGSGPRPCGHSWDDNRTGRSDCASCHRAEENARRLAQPNPAHDRVRLIRQLAQDDQPVSEIAVIAGVSTTTVWRVLKGESYPNVR